MAKAKYPKRLGNRIRNARLSANLSTEELANKLGKTTVTISNYEMGRRCPTLKTLVKISEVTERSLIYILGDYLEYAEEETIPEYYITIDEAVKLLKSVSREHRSGEFVTQIDDIIHCINNSADWGVQKS